MAGAEDDNKGKLALREALRFGHRMKQEGPWAPNLSWSVMAAVSL